MGKTLKSHFSQLPNSSFSSWKDDFLPNILWAACLRGNLDQETALNLFRQVVSRFRERFNNRNDVSLCHDNLAHIANEDFDYVFQDLFGDKQASKLLRPLALIDSLPDINHWRRAFSDVEDNDIEWNVIAAAMMATLDHQSQEATDIRWLKVISFCVIGRLRIPETMADELRLYPDEGDQRKVRPTIRAAEMSLRNFETGSERSVSIEPMEIEPFWRELLGKTSCVQIQTPFSPAPNPAAVQKEISYSIDAIRKHFMNNLESTSVDAKMDGAFGICLYATNLCFEVSISPSQQMAGGRILLRSIVESFITLSYLVKKDDLTLWRQYRNYGAGQTALAFIKTSDADEWPAFVNLERLEMLANEDVWHEMRDIDLGSWANSDLRKMSEFAGVKDVYDKYYDWASGFSHGHWGCVRDTTLTTCLNPLHRLHRIPTGLSQMPSVLEDCCKISNRIIDLLNGLYPTIKRRIDWSKEVEKDKP